MKMSKSREWENGKSDFTEAKASKYWHRQMLSRKQDKLIFFNIFGNMEKVCDNIEDIHYFSLPYIASFFF